jgi:hypothetical protein
MRRLDREHPGKNHRLADPAAAVLPFLWRATFMTQ